MKHLLSLESLSTREMEYLIDSAGALKQGRGHLDPQVLAGQVWALIFNKSSTRTRVSFEVGIRELGGSPMFLSGHDMQIGRGEPVRDTARVLSSMVDGAIIRTYAQSDVEEFAHFGNLPTINALTDEEHPCQILADLQTIEERLGSWRGTRVVFLGDADCNVARSWMWAAARLDFDLVLSGPEAYLPPAGLREQIAEAGGRVTYETDARSAADGADVLYTDVWVSMGKEEEGAERIEALRNHQINAALVARAKPGALVMHCLPAYREKEITEEVLENHAETIFTQAENRLHAQKAILLQLARAWQ
ncbi:MAG: ornithine carbamoyltransferase [Akkermansiaceae bacterium]|nr:ornithine carbamoyltransferase [Akkermansiaceae bacterium]